MMEWVLVFVLYLSEPEKGEIRDIAPQVVTGFSSKEACEIASSRIAFSLIVSSGKSRKAQGIKESSEKSSPAYYSECVEIKK